MVSACRSLARSLSMSDRATTECAPCGCGKVMEEETEGLVGSLHHCHCQECCSWRPACLHWGQLLVCSNRACHKGPYVPGGSCLWCEVTIVTKLLTIEVVKCLQVFGVIYITTLKTCIKNDVYFIVLELNFVCWWSRNHFLQERLLYPWWTVVALMATWWWWKWWQPRKASYWHCILLRLTVKWKANHLKEN